MEDSMNLKIVTRHNEVTFTNVIEYVAGKLNFYVHHRRQDGSTDTEVISRSLIRSVFRFTDDREWQVSLKRFKGTYED
jgi:hypothetical protein